MSRASAARALAAHTAERAAANFVTHEITEYKPASGAGAVRPPQAGTP